MMRKLTLAMLLMVIMVINIDLYNAAQLGIIVSISSIVNSINIVSIVSIIDIVSIHLGTRRSGRVCQRPVTVSKAFRMGMLMLTMNVNCDDS